MRLITVGQIVRRECERIEAKTGDYPLDWLSECAEDIWSEWLTDDQAEPADLESEIEAKADQYIEFIQTAYPERMKGE